MKVVFTCVCECARVLFFFFFFYSRIPLLIFLLIPVFVVPFVFRASPAVKGTTVVFFPLFLYFLFLFFFSVCRRPAVDTALGRRRWWEFRPDDDATVRGQQQRQVRFRTHQSDLSARAVMPAREHSTGSTSSSGPQPSSAAVRE